MRKLKMYVLLGGLVAALSLASVGIAAKPRDANGDKLPDRWEKRHKLSLKVNQAKRDQDRDGVRNRGEFRLGTDPRDADTDDDGTDDGEDRKPCKRGEHHGPPPPPMEEPPTEEPTP